ncbi:MAG: hypothetical protein WC873_04610 [Candidatus Gracilibacteria bacterium]
MGLFLPKQVLFFKLFGEVNEYLKQMVALFGELMVNLAYELFSVVASTLV